MRHQATHRTAVHRKSVHRKAVRLSLAGLLSSSALSLAAVHAAANASTALTVSANGSALSGAVLDSSPTLVEVGGAGLVSVKFLLDGTYLGVDKSSPFQWSLTPSVGTHELKVRGSAAAGGEIRAEAAFRVGSATDPPPTDPPTTGGVVDTVAEIRAAVAGARPGAVIDVADGEYMFRPRLVASANGTASAPVILRGSRAAMLRSSSASGDYGLHVTGDYWRIEGLMVAHATKGVVLDQSVGTVIDGIEVYDIGDEGVHFRWCSADGVLRNSYVHQTGVRSPNYGEGVYVGSANSNWSKYSCVDGRDNSERVLIEGNVFRDIAAEGADLKEGTESGTLRGNTFDNAGFGGSNSADSAVDVKGNGWLIEDNLVQNGSGAFLDAFQSHTVSSGYGTGNVFRRNTVQGALPGWGFGLYPAAGNFVACTNVAPGAAKGLSSAPCG